MRLVAVLFEETVKCLLLSDGEFAGLDARVIHPEEGVNVIHGLCADVRELLDLGGGILDLSRRKVDEYEIGGRTKREGYEPPHQ